MACAWAGPRPHASGATCAVRRAGHPRAQAVTGADERMNPLLESDKPRLGRYARRTGLQPRHFGFVASRRTSADSSMQARPPSPRLQAPAAGRATCELPTPDPKPRAGDRTAPRPALPHFALSHSRTPRSVQPRLLRAAAGAGGVAQVEELARKGGGRRSGRPGRAAPWARRPGRCAGCCAARCRWSSRRRGPRRPACGRDRPACPRPAACAATPAAGAGCGRSARRAPAQHGALRDAQRRASSALPPARGRRVRRRGEQGAGAGGGGARQGALQQPRGQPPLHHAAAAAAAPPACPRAPASITSATPQRASVSMCRAVCAVTANAATTVADGICVSSACSRGDGARARRHRTGPRRPRRWAARAPSPAPAHPSREGPDARRSRRTPRAGRSRQPWRRVHQQERPERGEHDVSGCIWALTTL